MGDSQHDSADHLPPIEPTMSLGGLPERVGRGYRHAQPRATDLPIQLRELTRLRDYVETSLTESAPWSRDRR